MNKRLAALRQRLNLWLLPDQVVLKQQYRERLGRELDLANPQGLHEKLCWLRLNRLTPLHSYCADKITVAAYVASRVGLGYTARRYFTTRDPQVLGPEAIPAKSCVIKANHESQHVMLVPDTATADWPHIRAEMARSLGRNFYHMMRERQYARLRPVIIVEEMFGSGQGAGDLNIYCVAGKPRFYLQFAEGAIANSQPAAARSVDGTPLAISRQLRPFVENGLPRPAALSQMMEIAEKLAEPFPFVRVDFLMAGERFWVNELTYTPFAGYNRFQPESFEMEMGALIDLKASAPDWRHYLAEARKFERDVLPPER